MKPRYTFIEKIKAKLVSSVPLHVGTEAQVRSSIAKWEAGEAPASPLDRGVFAMCDKVKRDIQETT